MIFIRYLLTVFAVMTTTFFISGCELYKEHYNLQGKAGDIADAMEHCRALMEFNLHEGTYIYFDTASSRETTEFFEIFLHLQDSTQEGFAHCQVNKQGLITGYAVRDFAEETKSFAD